jgi:hypothetical protein
LFLDLGLELRSLYFVLCSLEKLEADIYQRSSASKEQRTYVLAISLHAEGVS